MILACIVFLAGVLTILSPCILPVLPFVFARSDRKFLTNGLPMLIGMAMTFAGVATLAAVGGAWAVRFNQYGRTLALVLLAAFAATLLSRRLADALARPFVALGNRLSQRGRGRRTRRHRHVAAAGRRHRPAVGALRGSDSRPAADGRGAVAARHRARRCCCSPTPRARRPRSPLAILAGGRVVRRTEALARRRRMAAARRSASPCSLAVAGIALGWDASVLTRLSPGAPTAWSNR